MSSKVTVLAADIGGSSVKAALISSAGEVVAQAALNAPAPDAGPRRADRACGLVESVSRRRRNARKRRCIRLRHGDGDRRHERHPHRRSCSTRSAPIRWSAQCRRATPARADDRGTRHPTSITARNAAEAAHYDALPSGRPAQMDQRRAARGHHQSRGRRLIRKDFFHRREVDGPHCRAIPIATRAWIVAAADPTRGPSLLARLGLPERSRAGSACPGQRSSRAGASTIAGAPFEALAGCPVVMASHDTWCGVVGLGALVCRAAPTISPAPPRHSAC